MSRGVFRSHNKVGETMSFQTNASSATTFDPRVVFKTGSDRVSWDMGDGNGYQAGNSISYVYSADTGSTKTVTLRTNKLRRLRAIDAEQENIVGNLDLSGWVNLENAASDVFNYNQFGQNTQMTGITNPNSAVNGKILTHYNIYNSDITGVLVLTGLTLGGYFDVSLNSNLTNILHGPSNESFTNRYHAFQCDLTGNIDLSMLTGLGSDFKLHSNSNLTGITHTASSQTFSTYRVNSCNLTGNHDLSMFPNLGGQLQLYNNSNLTGVTHTASSQTFSTYHIYNCNLTGNHDVSMFPNLGGQFLISNNSNLTSVTHTASTQVFNSFWVFQCDLTGNYDLTMFPNLGGNFDINNNSNLTSVTHTATSQTFSVYAVHNCNISGTHDISMLSGLGGGFAMHNNSGLENITNPISTGNFSSYHVHNCILSYINFLPLSGATMSDIELQDNGMTAAEVNHILDDFYELNNTYSQPGWSGVTLDISGTNAAPDATSGGYDGTTAKTRLINDYGWSITSS